MGLAVCPSAAAAPVGAEACRAAGLLLRCALPNPRVVVASPRGESDLGLKEVKGNVGEGQSGTALGNAPHPPPRAWPQPAGSLELANAGVQTATIVLYIYFI